MYDEGFIEEMHVTVMDFCIWINLCQINIEQNHTFDFKATIRKLILVDMSPSLVIISCYFESKISLTADFKQCSVPPVVAKKEEAANGCLIPCEVVSSI